MVVYLLVVYLIIGEWRRPQVHGQPVSIQTICVDKYDLVEVVRMSIRSTCYQFQPLLIAQ
jgi:hypothetical protein